MRTIRISDEVWNAIAHHGKFGETPDDVLRRVFEIEPVDKLALRRRATTRKMTAKVENGHLSVAFAGGASKTWPLPIRDDKRELRAVRDEAVTFIEHHGATEGQVKGLMRVMTGAGYHLTK
ncbi:MAG: hypothetical protein ACE5IR_18855 [bacterium]